MTSQARGDELFAGDLMKLTYMLGSSLNSPYQLG